SNTTSPNVSVKLGNTNTSALASGTPVAAFEATGPKDVIPGSNAGTITPIGGDLSEGARACLDLDRATCRAYAEGYSWKAVAMAFLENLQPLPTPERRRFWQRLRRKKKTWIDWEQITGQGDKNP
ncbi:MAG: hypothetical protein AAGJ85_02215, partial [Pseudomonadota bacterium]